MKLTRQRNWLPEHVTFPRHLTGSSSETSMVPEGELPQSGSLSHLQLKEKNQNYSKVLFLCEIVLVTISRDSSDFNSYSKGMHRRLCKQVNWSDWQVTGGQSGGSSLPSRQSGEKSHFHLRGMHFWPSAHWKTSGSLQSKLTSRRWPCTIAKDNNRVINLIMIMLRSWIRETFLQTEMSALTH